MVKATKNKAGTWSCRAYYKDSNTGKIYRPVFTADKKAAAEKMALEFLANIERKIQEERIETSKLSFKMAAEGYIESRSSILSPSTITGYSSALRNAYGPILSVDINSITGEDVQGLVNHWAQNVKPKTVRNYYGFLTAVLKAYRPDFSYSALMPRKVRPDLYTPDDADIKKLLDAVKGTRMEIPVLLSALGSLRRSELCALTAEDVKDGYIVINKAVVLDVNNKWVLKNTTKTEAGTRITYLPKEVTRRIKKLVPNGQLVDMNPNQLSSAFYHVVKNAGLPHFRFHALRSYYASVLHALGIPDKYIMEWGGWHDEHTLHQHYQKALADKIPEMAAVGTKHFSSLLG